MSQTPLQIRRVSEKVTRYYQKFGYRSYTVLSSNQSRVYATKGISPDMIMCRIAETSRGLAVGFYAINRWIHFLVFIPFILTVGLLALSNVPQISPYITGVSAPFDINYIHLLLGTASTFIWTYVVLLLIPIAFSYVSWSIQMIRLNNLKVRFSFFTKDAVWNPKEISPGLIGVRSAESGIFHGWLLAIFYFAVFAMSERINNDVLSLYNASSEQFSSAVSEGFTIVIGAIVGLVAAFKAHQLRKEYAKVDRSLRIRGELIERRMDAIIDGIQVALISAMFMVLFLSVTFLQSASLLQSSYILFGSVLGGGIAGLIKDEGLFWFAGTYISILFFSALALVFRTGKASGFAFVVVQLLLLLPAIFLLFASLPFNYVLEKRGIRTVETMFNLSSFTALLSYYLSYKHRKKAKTAYMETLEEEIVYENDGAIIIDHDRIAAKGELALKVVKHYFELLLWYNASFDENDFVLQPTSIQMTNWWTNRTKQNMQSSYTEFVNFADRIIWDEEFQPQSELLAKHDGVGTSMVLAIQ